MWTALDLRIAEGKLNLVLAKKRFEMEVSRFQPELDLFLLQTQVWAATHRKEGR